MKRKPEYVEGEQALANFDNAMTALMKVPHSEIKARLDEEKQRKRPPAKRSNKRTNSLK